MSKILNRGEYKVSNYPSDKDLKEKISFILALGTLAPSTHNIQPWFFKIGDNYVDVFLDKDLKLPKADPTGRDAHISLGCCVENIILASRYFGIFNDVEYTFKDNYLVRINFKKDGVREESLKDFVYAIVDRFDARGKFEKYDLSDEYAEILNKLNDFENLSFDILKGDKQHKLSVLTASGLREAHADTKFRRELAVLINHGLSKRSYGIPAFSMRMPFFLSFFIPKAVYYFNLSFILSKLNQNSVDSASAVAVVSSVKDDPRQWFDVGRLSERAMLKIFSLGLKSSIYIASVEIGDRYKKVKDMIDKDHRPQFVFAFGKMNLKLQDVPRTKLELKIK